VRKRIGPRLTYANVMSSIAVFLALGGGVAWAHGKIATKDIRKAAVTTPKIAPRAVKPGKIAPAAVRTGKIANESVTAEKLAAGVAVSGPQGDPGPQGNPGPQGAQGPAGTALAYAQVSPFGASGSLVASRTSGFDGLARPSTGLYCLQPAADVIAQAFSGGSPTRPAMATLEWGNTSNQTQTLSVLARGFTGNCPSNRYEVRTYRNGALSDTVAFFVIVP
jgi:hypothetical protein